MDIGLEQGLSPGYADILRPERLDFGNNGRDCLCASLVIGVGRVTVAAAQIAAGGANKHRWSADPRALALNAVEYLINLDHALWATNVRY